MCSNTIKQLLLCKILNFLTFNTLFMRRKASSPIVALFNWHSKLLILRIPPDLWQRWTIQHPLWKSWDKVMFYFIWMVFCNNVFFTSLLIRTWRGNIFEEYSPCFPSICKEETLHLSFFKCKAKMLKNLSVFLFVRRNKFQSLAVRMWNRRKRGSFVPLHGRWVRDREEKDKTVVFKCYWEKLAFLMVEEFFEWILLSQFQYLHYLCWF